MFPDLINRGSFTSVLVPTLLNQLPSASTEADVPRLFRLARPLTLYDVQYDLRLPASFHSERGATGKDFIDNYSKGIDVCLLGNSGVTEAEHLRVEQFGSHVRPRALELVGARRQDEGHGGQKGRKTKVGDTGPSGRPVLNEDVALGRDAASEKLTLTRANAAADTDNVNSLLSGHRGQFHIDEDIVSRS